MCKVLFVFIMRNTAQRFPSDRHADTYFMLLWETHVAQTFFLKIDLLTQNRKSYLHVLILVQIYV